MPKKKARKKRKSKFLFFHVYLKRVLAFIKVDILNNVKPKT